MSDTNADKSPTDDELDDLDDDPYAPKFQLAPQDPDSAGDGVTDGYDVLRPGFDATVAVESQPPESDG